jgi:hypothetical protein
MKYNKFNSPQISFFGIFVIIGVISITILTFGSIGFGLVRGFGFGSGTVQNHAQTYAANYARTLLNEQNPRVLCAGLDTDNNGYVACSIETSGTPIQIECPANLFFEPSTNCKIPQIIVVNQQIGQ